jgi:hypothetical protein
MSKHTPGPLPPHEIKGFCTKCQTVSVGLTPDDLETGNVRHMVKLCPFHAAAPELLATLRLALKGTTE